MFSVWRKSDYREGCCYALLLVPVILCGGWLQLGGTKPRRMQLSHEKKLT